MDVPTISAALTGIKAATDISKAIMTAGASLEKAELKLRIADLVDSLTDARAKILDIRELLDQKDQEIERLKKREGLKFDGDVYWLENEDKSEDGPFCPNCFDDKGKCVHIHEDGPGWFCYVCKRHWGKPREVSSGPDGWGGI